MGPPDILTEEVLFNVPTRHRQEALATIGRWAEACELHIDTVEEQPKRLSVDMRVRVIGKPENIATFCKETGGRRSEDPVHIVRRWIGGIIDGIVTNWP